MLGALLLVFGLTSTAALLVGTSCDSGATCRTLQDKGWLVGAPGLILVVTGLVSDRAGIRRHPRRSDLLYLLAIGLSAVILLTTALYVGLR
jgi:uncharacterized membrane protein